MIAKDPKVVFDPYLLLPSYGESSIKLSHESGKLALTIHYDTEDKLGKEINIAFTFPCYHRLSAFPGVSASKVHSKGNKEISSLVEFEYSDFKNAWESHFNHLFKFRHFEIFFISENYFLEVICKDIKIET